MVTVIPVQTVVSLLKKFSLIISKSSLKKSNRSKDACSFSISTIMEKINNEEDKGE